MQVILLERVAKLGQMGDVVDVKPGYARNYLLLQGKALTASQANIAAFEGQKAQLEAHNLETKTEAEAMGDKLNGQQFIVIRQASDAGSLYGSVTTRDAAEAATAHATKSAAAAHPAASREAAATLEASGGVAECVASAVHAAECRRAPVEGAASVVQAASIHVAVAEVRAHVAVAEVGCTGAVAEAVAGVLECVA